MKTTLILVFLAVLAGCSAADTTPAPRKTSSSSSSSSSSGGSSSSSSSSSSGAAQTYVGFESVTGDCVTCLPSVLAGSGVCAAKYAACTSDPGCVTAMGCVESCKGNPPCIANCNTGPAYTDKLSPYLQCTCCISPCGSTCQTTCAFYDTIAGPALCQ